MSEETDRVESEVWRSRVTGGLLVLCLLIPAVAVTWGWRKFSEEPEFGSLVLLASILWSGIAVAVLLLLLAVFRFLTREKKSDRDERPD